MEWWQYLIVSLTSVVVGAVLGYFFTARGAGREKQERERKELLDAMTGILAEVDGIIELAVAGKRRGGGMLVPFPTDRWDVEKGHMLRLSGNVQEALHQMYGAIATGNTIVQLNLHLPYGSGALDAAYRNQSEIIEKNANEAKELLTEALQQGSGTGWLSKDRLERAKSREADS